MTNVQIKFGFLLIWNGLRDVSNQRVENWFSFVVFGVWMCVCVGGFFIFILLFLCICRIRRVETAECNIFFCLVWILKIFGLALARIGCQTLRTPFYFYNFSANFWILNNCFTVWMKLLWIVLQFKKKTKKWKKI